MSVGTAQTASVIPAENSADPSMEDILASIRRILSEDDPSAAPPDAEAADDSPLEDDGVLVLDESMRVEPPAISPEPALTPASSNGLLADVVESAAVASVSQMMRSLNSERLMPVYRGGPTLEDMVLETMRPMLKSWLDQNLPTLVERLVRNEIERVAARAMEG